jgi:hypothetical protein
MHRFLRARVACFALLVSPCLVVGCGGKKTPPLTPVSGKVTVDGQPLTSGQVTFVPDVARPTEDRQDNVQTAGLSTGKIGSDGSYTIITNGKSGAPLGKYKVTVTPSMVPAPDAKGLPPTSFDRKKYSEEGLKIEVVANPEPGRYDLKLTK